MISTTSNKGHPGSIVSSLPVAAYAALTTIVFGATLLDIVYSRSNPDATYSEAADFLLLLIAVMILSGIMAVGFSWRSKLALIFVGASLVMTCLSILFPVLVLLFVPAIEGSFVTTGIRLLLSGLVSGFAYVGLFFVFRPI